MKISAVAYLASIRQMSSLQSENSPEAFEKLAFGRKYSGQTVRDWTLNFLKQGGICRGVSFKRRDETSLIQCILPIL